MIVFRCSYCKHIGDENEIFIPGFCPNCEKAGHLAIVDRGCIINEKEIETLWKLFGNIPINENDEIEEEFLGFPEGTDRFEIWHWFDEVCPKGVKALTEVK